MPTIHALVITSTAAAALALTGCSTEPPLRHGEVIAKHGQEGRWITDYENVYRNNCTSVHTSAFTMPLTGRSTGGSGSGSSSSGKGKSLTGGSSKSNGTKPGGTKPGDNSLTSGASNGSSTSGSSGSTGGQPTQRCHKEYAGRKETGRHWQAGRWELKLRDGDRTGWIKVSEHTYDTTDLHDHI
ncbi:hypothetical protein ABZ896_22815 [Streptomyces sp. NPDC047072]|uniref:hypothetical protein n=1 Tax=Streptomyces sp. NPDC047072 TaxID=3154809 RepID=UPI0033E7CFCE